MSSVVRFRLKDNVIDKIGSWHFGSNWPIVYIFYNSSKVYIGETLDACRRVGQHISKPSFNDFTDVCLISDKTFNKSVIIDLESYLIKYIGAEGSKKITNSNAGVRNHNYFYKEAYYDDFKEIWNKLIGIGIVKKTIIDIENSELFKYSPYKSLNKEQEKAAYTILNRIYEMNNSTKQSLIQVVGGAGTGKTILAVFLVKLLIDINNQKEVWRTIDDSEDAAMIEKLSHQLSGIRSIGFVVPMIELRRTMKKIFNSIEGLSPKMIYSPEEVVEESYFDVLIVDEAHRLYRNRHLPQGAAAKFKKVNPQLMGDTYQNKESDLTELDWIIRSSRLQVLFYDSRQSIRTPDIDKERFEAICKPHLYKYIELYSQMRCKGGNGYYEYIKEILEGSNLTFRSYKKIHNYKIAFFDHITELVDFINANNNSDGLSKIIAGPGWTIKEDIILEGKTYHWAGSGLNDDFIHSIHKIQGFDLNFAGVIFGREIFYSKETGRIEVNRKNLKDKHAKPTGNDEAMRRYVLNIYLTLMTRGIYGTFIYVIDDDLKEYLKTFLI